MVFSQKGTAVTMRVDLLEGEGYALFHRLEKRPEKVYPQRGLLVQFTSKGASTPMASISQSGYFSHADTLNLV